MMAHTWFTERPSADGTNIEVRHWFGGFRLCPCREACCSAIFSLRAAAAVANAALRAMALLSSCFLFMRSSATKIGQATKIDEYAPEVQPTSKANAKFFNVGPPKKYNAAKVSKTVIKVLMERVMV